jgi:hypothetical protein
MLSVSPFCISYIIEIVDIRRIGQRIDVAGPFGPRSDIASKSGFFVYVREAKKFSALLGGEIWIKIHLNIKTG